MISHTDVLQEHIHYELRTAKTARLTKSLSNTGIVWSIGLTVSVIIYPVTFCYTIWRCWLWADFCSCVCSALRIQISSQMYDKLLQTSMGFRIVERGQIEIKVRKLTKLTSNNVHVIPDQFLFIIYRPMLSSGSQLSRINESSSAAVLLRCLFKIQRIERMRYRRHSRNILVTIFRLGVVCAVKLVNLWTPSSAVREIK